MGMNMRAHLIDFCIAAIVVSVVCYLMGAAKKRDEFLQSVRQQEITAKQERDANDLQEWRELDAQSRAMTSFDLIVSSNK
jgi:hypothetical protein